MRVFVPISVCLGVFSLLVLIVPVEGPAQDMRKAIEDAGPGPIVIKSNTLEVDNQSKVVTFVGEVWAEKQDFVVECEKMFVYYESLPASEEGKQEKTKIQKIVATGQVRINRAQGGMATAERAEYFQDAEKVVLTGKPVVKQGSDFVEGDRITLFLEENRSVVEASEDRKVRAVIFPRSEKQ